jgi:hypothetical protein
MGLLEEKLIPKEVEERRKNKYREKQRDLASSCGAAMVDGATDSHHHCDSSHHADGGHADLGHDGGHSCGGHGCGGGH